MLVGEGRRNVIIQEKWKLGIQKQSYDWGWRGENNPFVALALSSTKAQKSKNDLDFRVSKVKVKSF